MDRIRLHRINKICKISRISCESSLILKSCKPSLCSFCVLHVSVVLIRHYTTTHRILYREHRSCTEKITQKNYLRY